MAFQAIHNTILGGIINCDEFEQCIVVHAGVPSDLAGIPLGSTCLPLGSEETNVGWVSSQELVQFQQNRNREFQKPGGPGIDTSVTMVCNYYGTRSESAVAFDNAAARVLQTYKGNLDASPNVRSRRHMRDLMSHKEWLESGQLCNLSFKHDDFWSEERIEEHYQLCVEKGGCERGRMAEGTAKDAHVLKSEGGGGSKRGRMVGTAKDEHRKKSEVGGSCLRGPMPDGPDKAEHMKKCMKGDAGIHIANMVMGPEKKNALLLQLANGKLKQGHERTESCN